MDFWRDRPVLVTGATGLVGGWLVERLENLGAEVTIILRDIVQTSFDIHASVALGDVTDQAFMERVLGENHIETVFHLAAQTLVGVANKNPLSTFESNIKGTWTVLEAARRSELVKKVIVASSDKAYGSSTEMPYNEGHPLEGRHPYDVSKSCADLIAHAYRASYQMDVAVTRCGNFFGGGDLNWSRIVPGTIRSVLRGQCPVIRSDGSLVRDYLYIEDGVDAYLRLAEERPPAPPYPACALGQVAWNFSYEQPVSVRTMVDRILRAMGREDLQPIVQNEASNEIHEQWLSSKQARRLLRWEPRFGFDEGMQRTIAWYKEHLR
jgi:CDP-glucose 4,6-dehydratase